jgi:hypothetical protein
MADEEESNLRKPRVHYAREDDDTAPAGHKENIHRSIVRRRNTTKAIRKTEKRTETIKMQQTKQDQSRLRSSLRYHQRAKLYTPYESFLHRNPRASQEINASKMRPAIRRKVRRDVLKHEQSVLHDSKTGRSPQRDGGYFVLSSESEDLESPGPQNLETSLNSMGCEVFQ